MNSTTQKILNIFFDSSNIILSSISIIISIGMFIFIIYHLIKIKNSPNRVALLLTANVYAALFFSSISTFEQYIHVLPGHIYSLSYFNNGIICQIRTYIQWVSVSTICYSNTLQSIYRLCRIIFYTKQSLQSFKNYKIIILIQWIICFLIILPALLFNDFKYSINDYSCQHEPLNFRSIFVNGAFTYSIPMFITGGCYIYTLKKIRRENNNLTAIMTQIQQITVRRDLIVLLRICILFGLLLIVCIPGGIIIIIYLLTGIEPWWSTQIERTILILSTTIFTIILTFTSPHVSNLWKRNSHQFAIIPVII